MTDHHTMSLEIWQGDWGLPSIDHQCLTAMAYCKFSSVPITFKKTNDPCKSPNGELPVLRDQASAITDVINIFNYLRKEQWGTDHDLTEKQCADIVAFSALIDEKLLPALHYLWWVNAKVYTEFTRPCFAKKLSFPMRFYYPWKKRKECEARIESAKWTESLTEQETENKIFKEAKECLNLLSTKLGNNEYFFGQMPTSLDAVVFGVVAALLKVPTPNTVLQNHVKNCDNLSLFCQRILSRFFPVDPEELKTQREEEEAEKQKQVASTEFPHRLRNMFISTLVALTAMVSYAFISGLVQVEMADRGSDRIHSHKPQPPNFSRFDRFFEGQEDKSGERRDSDDRD